MDSITPIFLLSLPRSGSTLLQRLLAVHEAIATTTEPWVLLPLVYARRRNGSFSEYSQWRSFIAHEDFARSLPGGAAQDRQELATYVRRLYRAAAGPEPAYFLDKTPRYSLIAEDLLELFPDAGFIYLWRNPVAAAASMMQTWAGGRWNLDEHAVDFYRGLPRMIAAQQVHPDRIHCVQYERLLTDPHGTLEDVFRAIGLGYDPSITDRFADVTLEGRFGDQRGVKAYRTVSRDPLEKWKPTMGNAIRRRWARRYLRWLGWERLAVMGYDMDALLDELNSAPRNTRFLLSDAVRRATSRFTAVFDPNLLQSRRMRSDGDGPRIGHS